MNQKMQDLIYSKDWSSTPVGAREHWPPMLTTMVELMLHSKFPMFLFWGSELTCFYNDAFKPSLGVNGKHPSILGSRGSEGWSEIWEIIKPLIDQALSGEAIWREDLLVPFYRNGRIEDIYWTFSYSPIPDVDRKVCGVLVICHETTEKVLNTQRLEKSENKFRDIVYQAPIGIVIFRGPKFIVEMANETYLELIDKHEETVLNKPFFEILPEIESTIGPLLMQVMESGVPYYGKEFKVNLLRRGIIEERYFNFVYHPLREHNGAISGVIAVASEVTDQIADKFKIQESEKKFKDLVMMSPIPMTIFKGEDFVVEVANKVMFEKIWRKNPDDVVGKKILEVFPELNDQKYPALLRRVYTTGIIHNEKEAPALVHGDDGIKMFYLDFEYTPLHDVSGNVWGIMITVNDVTEKVEARKRIEESQQRLNIVIDASELGIWEVNFVNQEISYSDRYLQILGYQERVSLTHAEILKHIHPDDMPVREAAYKRALATGILHYEARLIWNDGTTHWMEGKGKVFFDDQHAPIRMVGTLRDITEQKQQEAIQKSFTAELERQVFERTRELEFKNRDLEKMNAELQSFAYVSSHDLQEPLRKIQTFASRIKEKENLSERGQDYFNRMQDAANRMKNLIQDLLAYSRTSKVEPEFEEVSLSLIVEEVRNDFQESLVENNIIIEFGHLPVVRIIPLQFRQVMYNLISNGIKFSKKDRTSKIAITATPHIPGALLKDKFLAPDHFYTHIIVADNGIGFDNKYKDKIFEVFQRLHGRHEYSGTGVGLAIVKKIVENHNGFIEAESMLGEGATFNIYLPE
ncbi:PAS domain-containing protein [Pseudochryseolinea flava]|uniref:histidine kinase n=1 Tax=Pseudochryseolinea flava TaxID=2059302 RepID=A0A364Y7F3_9BACT|nr:PAS domain-containing protein [Pseudochryseolinea flava]RAW02907.1 PAS domain-containing sensor histidine kinase [Pseudochryseolinea flava]